MDTNLPQTSETLEKAFNFFKESFKTDAKAREYLQNQRLLNIEELEKHGIEFGFNNGLYFKGLPEAEKQLCKEAGLLVPNGSPNKYTIWAKECVIFPLRDANGQLTGLAGRLTTDKKGFNHYLLKNCKGLLRYPSQTTKRLILTEGNIDGLTLLQSEEIRKGFEIMPINGTNGLTDLPKEIIKQLPNLQEIILFFDGDQAGITAAEKYAKDLSKELPNIEISTVMLPDGEDVNSIFIKESTKALMEYLDQRFSLYRPENKQTSEPDKQPVPEQNPDSPHFQIPSSSNFQIGINYDNPLKITYTTPTAVYYIKGGLRKELDNMRVSIDIENRETNFKKREKLDLYIDKLVEKLAREAAEKLDLRADMIEADLSKLTDLLDTYREQVLLPEDDENHRKNKDIPVPAKEAAECLDFLKQKQLMKAFLQKIRQAGLVGEDRNCLLVFCIGSSARMIKTLHGIIQSTSGVGKTYQMNTICEMMPDEYCISLTGMTDKSLFNIGKYGVRSHLFSIEDRSSMSEETRLYFRELISKEEISRHVTQADKDGTFRTVFQIVLGPIASLSCTTHADLLIDDANRCFLISVDESPEQIKRIIDQRNKRSAGLLNEKKENEAKAFIKNCIRMLKPCKVVNPYAMEIHLPDNCKDINRLHELFTRLVGQVTLLHQFQRQKDSQGRLIATLADIEIAIYVMFDAIVLKADDLNEKQRKFYENLKALIKKLAGENCQKYEFKQREIRMGLNISGSSAKNYLRELVEMEYIEVVVHNENRGNIYKIAWWDDNEAMRDKIKNYLQQQIDQIKSREGDKTGQK